MIPSNLTMIIVRENSEVVIIYPDSWWLVESIDGNPWWKVRRKIIWVPVWDPTTQPEIWVQVHPAKNRTYAVAWAPGVQHVRHRATGRSSETWRGPLWCLGLLEKIMLCSGKDLISLPKVHVVLKWKQKVPIIMLVTIDYELNLVTNIKYYVIGTQIVTTYYVISLMVTRLLHSLDPS